MRYRHELPIILVVIRIACAIALLPDHLMEEGLQILRDTVREEHLVAAYLLWPFFDYVEEKWLNNPSRRAWMSFWKCALRTNNSSECHNRLLRQAVGAYRPNVWFFIEAIARLEHNASLDLPHLVAGGKAKRARSWRSVYADQQLESLADDLEEDVFHDMQETIWNFISQAGDLLQGAFNDHMARDGE